MTFTTLELEVCGGGTTYEETAHPSVGAAEGALSEVIKTLSLFVQTNTALAVTGRQIFTTALCYAYTTQKRLS